MSSDSFISIQLSLLVCVLSLWLVYYFFFLYLCSLKRGFSKSVPYLDSSSPSLTVFSQSLVSGGQTQHPSSLSSSPSWPNLHQATAREHKEDEQLLLVKAGTPWVRVTCLARPSTLEREIFWWEDGRMLCNVERWGGEGKRSDVVFSGSGGGRWPRWRERMGLALRKLSTFICIGFSIKFNDG